MKKVYILGFGQIGKSIYGLYDGKEDLFDVHAKDVFPLTAVKEFNDEDIAIDVLHVCIPYVKSFKDDVKKIIEKHNPEVTIIHSTIDIGTTKELTDDTNAAIVHSPVMGKHPNLTESIKTFTKIIGADNPHFTQLAKAHFDELGVDTVVFYKSEESEAAKLLDTTYYGWNILYMKYVHKFCNEYNLDFENVYTTTNEIYNEGYAKFGDHQYVRPILRYFPGKIGGHCVRPNFEILRNRFYPAELAIEMDEDEEL